MEKIKTGCDVAKKALLFIVVVATMVTIVLNPQIFFTEPWTLIHWYGMALLSYVIVTKIQGYIKVFENPQLALVVACVQLAISPFIISYIVTYTHIPLIVASAIVLATLSPGATLKNFISNLCMSLFMLAISWYILPSTSEAVSSVYTTTTSMTTRYIVIGIAIAIFIFYEIKKKWDDHHQDELLEIYEVIEK